MDPQLIKQTEQKQLNQGIPNLHCTMCATSAVLVTIITCKKLGANELKILKYANSGDTAGPATGRIVGYGAAAIYKK